MQHLCAHVHFVRHLHARVEGRLRVVAVVHLVLSDGRGDLGDELPRVLRAIPDSTLPTLLFRNMPARHRLALCGD